MITPIVYIIGIIVAYILVKRYDIVPEYGYEEENILRWLGVALRVCMAVFSWAIVVLLLIGRLVKMVRPPRWL